MTGLRTCFFPLCSVRARTANRFPGNWVIKLLTALDKDIEQLRCRTDEQRACPKPTAMRRAILLDPLLKEVHILTAMSKGIFDHVLEVSLPPIPCCQPVSKKRHFWFDHPKLGQVTRCFGVLGAECWAKGVDPSRAVRIRFAFELPR